MQNAEIKNQNSRGGARPGAGRKPKVNARNIRASFSLSEKADANLRRLAEMEGCTRNDIINRMLEAIKNG